MKVIYLHGFGSTGTGPKVDQLKAAFGDENVIAPTLPFDPQQVRLIVSEMVYDLYDEWAQGEKTVANRPLKVVFVGTSLGGFYAMHFAHKFDAPAVIVNPTVMAHVSLAGQVGPHRNFETNDEFLVTMAHLDELKAMRANIEVDYKGSLVHVFVAKDDPVVNYEWVIKSLPRARSVNILDDGGHRFEKNWHLVIDKLKELEKE